MMQLWFCEILRNLSNSLDGCKVPRILLKIVSNTIIFFKVNIIDLQCCISFCCIAVIYIYIHVCVYVLCKYACIINIIHSEYYAYIILL